MFKAESSPVACPSCGKANSAREKFCVACAARLGEEPSIARTRSPAPASLPRRDSGFDAPRTVRSQPAALRAAPAETAGFWFKFCMAGLVVMLGFLGWALYVMTGSKAPAPLPAGPSGGPALSSERLPLPAAATAAPPPVTAGAPAAAVPEPPAAARPAPARPPETRRTAEASRAAARERSAPPPPTTTTTGQAPRPAPGADGRGLPSRSPAVTSSPQFRDAGPPVVAGPQPSDVSPPGWRGPTLPAPDLGPPIAVGPGPRYDYSTPNAGAPR